MQNTKQKKRKAPWTNIAIRVMYKFSRISGEQYSKRTQYLWIRLSTRIW